MQDAFSQIHPVHYLPIGTTVLAAIFFSVLIHRYFTRRSGPHLLWWAAGIFAYGLGTGLEGAITLVGNSIFLNKSWYIAGALLGGYPLAQGTVYLLLSRRTANILSAITVPFIVIVSVLVAIAPVNIEAMEAHRPSGAILGWQWVRLMTPLINTYAAIFLIGGAALSAWRYVVHQTHPNRALGNGLIAFGALLPGIGGGMAKAGYVEALYVGEFVGLIFIWAGYAACVRQPKPVQELTAEPTLAASS